MKRTSIIDVVAAVCALATLLVWNGNAFAQKGDGNKLVAGTIKKVDAATDTITVTIPQKGGGETDSDFKVGAATKFMIFNGDNKQELTGKDGLKNDQVKAGAKVSVTSDANGAVVTVAIGTVPGKKGAGSAGGKSVSGTIKKVDAVTDTITVTVTAKGGGESHSDFKVAAATKFMIFNGDNKQELTGKEGFKNDQLKAGAKVSVASDANGAVVMFTIGQAPKKNK